MHSPPHKLPWLKQQPLLSAMLWVGCTSRGKRIPDAQQERFRGERLLGSFQGCRRGGLQQGVEIFQPLGFIFPVCVSQQNITQVTFSAPLRKFRGGERSVPSHLPLLRPCQRVRSPAAQHRGAGAAPCPLNKRVRLPLCSVLCRSKDGMSLPTR